MERIEDLISSLTLKEKRILIENLWRWLQETKSWDLYHYPFFTNSDLLLRLYIEDIYCYICEIPKPYKYTIPYAYKIAIHENIYMLLSDWKVSPHTLFLTKKDSNDTVLDVLLSRVVREIPEDYEPLTKIHRLIYRKPNEIKDYPSIIEKLNIIANKFKEKVPYAKSINFNENDPINIKLEKYKAFYALILMNSDEKYIPETIDEIEPLFKYARNSLNEIYDRVRTIEELSFLNEAIVDGGIIAFYEDIVEKYYSMIPKPSFCNYLHVNDFTNYEIRAMDKLIDDATKSLVEQIELARQDKRRKINLNLLKAFVKIGFTPDDPDVLKLRTTHHLRETVAHVLAIINKNWITNNIEILKLEEDYSFRSVAHYIVDRYNTLELPKFPSEIFNLTDHKGYTVLELCLRKILSNLEYHDSYSSSINDKRQYCLNYRIYPDPIVIENSSNVEKSLLKKILKHSIPIIKDKLESSDINFNILIGDHKLSLSQRVFCRNSFIREYKKFYNVLKRKRIGKTSSEQIS